VAERRRFSGHRVRRARQVKRISRDELAQKLGVSARYISQIEAGHRTMIRRWPDLAEALGVPIDWFFVAGDDAEVPVAPRPCKRCGGPLPQDVPRQRLYCHECNRRTNERRSHGRATATA
jgi:transcriptional regulator with XRE-family HTH domain